MKIADPDLLRRIEKLIHTTQKKHSTAKTPDHKESLAYALTCLAALGDSVLQGRPVFGIEPWHPIHDDVPLDVPGEMLLRLKDRKGAALAPYPMIMAFYKSDMAADIDTVLVLCALRQFAGSHEKQASINISARSLHDPDFVKMILERVESLSLKPEQKIILEIHESTPSLVMNKKVLKLFRKAGVLFAIDDVGLSMNDVMRIAEFDGIADFIKLDRQSVCAHPDSDNSLDHVVSFIATLLPDTCLVAEGVKSAQHAAQLREFHPDIKYVQGLYLPDRETFAREWKSLPAVTPSLVEGSF